MSQKYAAYDDTGTIIAFYDDGVSPVPNGVSAIKITDDEWKSATLGGYTVVDKTLTPPAPLTSAQKLASAQENQIAILRAACGNSIVSGFQSSALGTIHTYPSKPADQINLIGAVASGSVVKFWCADSSGAWSFADHTAVQIKQVLDDGVTARVALSAKLGSLTKQVMAATTIQSVQGILW